MVVAAPAHADIGVPMIAAVAPASWFLLLPIIAIETVVAMKVLKKGFVDGFRVAAIANAVSTLIGIPLTWMVLALVEMIISKGGSAWGISTPLQKLAAVTLQSPWLIPYEEELHWMVPAAGATLCIPFFFMSVWCERFVAFKLTKKEQKRDVNRWAWIANGITYGLLFASLIVVALVALR